jgi:hypothetical protein
MLGVASMRLERKGRTMQSANLKSLDLDKIDGLLGSSVASEIRRMEQERASWTRAMAQSDSLAEQIKKLVGETSLAGQLAKQRQESQKAEQEGVRRMLDPLQDIRKGFLADSVTKQMLDALAKPSSALEQMTKLIEQSTESSALIQATHSSIEGSMESARKMLADASVSSGIGQLMKSFEEANKRWVVPQRLLDSLGALQALHEQMGRLSLPVMDAASAATLARVLGPEGIQAQLAAMGINPDGSINVRFVQQEEGIGLSRKALELMQLLSFILAVMIPYFQEVSSSQWQTATDKTLAAQTERIEAQGIALDGQRKTIEALSKLVEKALVQEAKRQEERFVVLDRVAEVRSKPEHGSAVDGKLLPREVVRLISERGKWIEFEYYHWLHKEHRTGWALKKYFQRVPANFERPDQQEAKAG